MPRKQIVGCSEVIGIAGSDEKCRWVEGLGADKCLNYKSKTFEDDLIKATDGFVDVYFDNVGVSTNFWPSISTGAKGLTEIRATFLTSC
jgi:NADPH-dependent curcumin reductase CurA